jgi:hypothetical protein
MEATQKDLVAAILTFSYLSGRQRPVSFPNVKSTYLDIWSQLDDWRTEAALLQQNAEKTATEATG